MMFKQFKRTIIFVFLGGILLSTQITLGAPRSKCTFSPGPLGIASESSYQGPLIDSHFHIPSPMEGSPAPVRWDGVTLADMACAFKVSGVKSAFAFFPVFPEGSYKRYLDVAREAKRKFPRQFIPFIMPPGKEDVSPTVSARELQKMLKSDRGLFKGYGEIGLYALEGKRRAETYAPDVKIFQDIYPILRKNNLRMIYFHPGEGHQDNLERVLDENPDISFIVHGEQIENEVADLMGRHSNLYFTANDLYGDQYLLHDGETKESFLEALRDFEPLIAKDLATWQTRIEAHPDQFMWGTDRGIFLWTQDKEVAQALADYGRAFIGRLIPAVQEKFAYKNAQRLVDASK